MEHSTNFPRISNLEWIHLYEAFAIFKTRAVRNGLYADDLRRIEDDLFKRCPIPQPKEMDVL